MNNKKLDAVQVWKQMEDLLAPQLSFSLTDRVVYSHLLRHSRLEGKRHFRFSIPWLSRGIRLSPRAAREAVRRMIARGVLRLVERNCQAHHVVRVLLPEEVPALRPAKTVAPDPARTACDFSFGETDFWRAHSLRRAIHARERGRCFYCLRKLIRRRRCLDHVVPRAQSGRNSYRNLVSCCLDCNSQKGERSAVEHVRCLYRERRLSDHELSGRLRALDELAAGKLIPPLPGQEDRKSEAGK